MRAARITKHSSPLSTPHFAFQFCKNSLTFAFRAFSLKRTKLFVMNLWRDDRPGPWGPKIDIFTASNEILPRTARKPGSGRDGTFQAASTSRAPLEAKITTADITSTIEHTSLSKSQNGIFKQSFFHSFSSHDDSVDSHLPDVSC